MNITSFRNIITGRRRGRRRAYFTSRRMQVLFANAVFLAGHDSPHLQKTPDDKGWVVYYD